MPKLTPKQFLQAIRLEVMRKMQEVIAGIDEQIKKIEDRTKN